MASGTRDTVYCYHALSGDTVYCYSISYISRRFSSDFDIVTSSANSRSLPTGIPIAIRVTFIPSGFNSRERYAAVASPSIVGFVAKIISWI